VRALLALGAVLAVLFGWAAPAAAHAGGLVATDARGRVVSLTPAVAGLSVVAVEDGARLRLRNGTAFPVGVPAGGGPATPAVVPAGGEMTWADSRATPVGRQIGAGRRVPWSLVLDVGGTAVTVAGVLDGVPAPPAVLWWLAVVAVAVAVPLLSRRARRGDLALAGTGLLVAAASLAHVTGSSLAVTSAPLAGTFADSAGIDFLAWPLLIGGAVAVVRGRVAGVLAVCAGAALTAVSVLPDVTAFHRGALPFAGPATLERILVVAALAGGTGVAVAGAAVLRGLAAAAEPQQ
jgi:hypothetical protein